ncbi:drug:proton antiporter [Pantoea sp. B270]|uniref:VOC family protein n=1 Tax=Pantoea sp. B270 TaxID=2836826 RepID=UPI000AFBF8F6|nr:VOC family protein [Pantoea sp. B270]MBU6519876.1 drug:proton antiporter [Pantoea sp. B270]
MLTANMTIIYVPNVVKTADFYAALFDIKPAELSPTFAMFVFESGFKLGIWSQYTVEPALSLPASAARSEIVFKTARKDDVDFLYHEWGVLREITIIQSPVRMDFGYTFTALDPDGHRLRVCYLQLDE